MILFVNTKMSHRPDRGKEIDYKDERAPQLLEIAMIQTEMTGEVVQAEHTVIEKDNQPQMLEALGRFKLWCAPCERLVAYNYTLAMLPIKAEFWFNYGKEPNFRRLLTQSVMKMVTEAVGAPGPYNKPKWPTLDQAYMHFFKTLLRSAPGVLTNLEATYQIYYKHLYDRDLPRPS